MAATDNAPLQGERLFGRHVELFMSSTHVGPDVEAKLFLPAAARDRPDPAPR